MTEPAYRIAAAASILDVSIHSSAEAVSLVPLVQVLLRDSHSTVIALSISCLRQLSLRYHLDVFLVYGVLQRLGLMGSRQCAQREICALLSLAAEEIADTTLRGEIEAILRELLQQSGMANPYGQVRVQALRSLSAFAQVARSMGDKDWQHDLVQQFFARRAVIEQLWLQLSHENSATVRTQLERLCSNLLSLEFISS